MQDELFNKLTEIDKIISDINLKLDYTKYLTPINLNEENNKFLYLYKKGIEYNPIYRYQPYESIDFGSLRQQIGEFELSDSPIENIFKRYLLFLDNLILLYQNRCDSNNFTNYSIKSFGFPDVKLIEKAYTHLKDNKLKKHDKSKSLTYDAIDLANKIKIRINKYGFEWKLIILDSSTTKVTVDSEARTIYLNGSMKYSDIDIKRLEVHEVDTHVIRAENGRSQSFNIFSSGLANSLATEEGIAVMSEEKNNVLDENILRLYAGRVIAVSLSKEKSFYEIFTELINYFNENDAIYITQRVKKGLNYTYESGGFTKDYVYFDGYLKIKNFLIQKNNPQILFVGSIGLDDISDVKNLLKTNIINKPKIIPAIFNWR